MRLAILAATVVAMTVVAAAPQTVSADPPGRWRCDVTGFWTQNVPAPQRRFFSATADSRDEAESAAMRKCRASPDVTRGTCGQLHCQPVD